MGETTTKWQQEREAVRARIDDLTTSCYEHLADAQEHERQHQSARKAFRESADDFGRWLEEIAKEA